MKWLASILALALCTAATVAEAGNTVLDDMYAKKTELGSTDHRHTYIGLIGDVQNIFTVNEVSDDYSDQIAQALVRQLVMVRPHFVIFLGDLTDSTGSNDGNADDLSWTGTFRDSEWSNFRTKIYDPLIAAGVPVFLITGNHDSCVGFEEWFPQSEWESYSWGFGTNVETDTDVCGTLDVNTEARVGRFQTPAGPICVVGVDYGADASGSDVANAEASIGCDGGTRPTIIVRHTNSERGEVASIFANAANSEIFSAVEGHTTAGSIKQSNSLSTSGGGWQFVFEFNNHQEIPECEDAEGLGPQERENKNTGLGWWSLMEIDALGNRISVTARSPITPNRPWSGPSGATQQHRCMIDPTDAYAPGTPEQYTHTNLTTSFATAWCTRFPASPSCL